jgi:Raf kinase inhibitor-like YbhB/YbcL family protein
MPVGGNAMIKKRDTGILLAAGSIALASWCTAATAADPFTLSSTMFKDGTMMPEKVTNKGTNCKGENISPQLSWSNPPDGTKSFAITLVDPEAGGGAGAIHWVAYGIPPDVTGFEEGETSKPSPKFVGGKNGGGKDTWQGPCAGPGAPHHYTFVLIATDLDPKELPPGLSRQELLAKLAPPAPAARRVTGTAGLVGLWRKP